MMANTGRAPSRTPPFVLVGLLVLVCILAYNYWSLSSQNKSLLAKNDKLLVETRDTAEKSTAVEKSLETLREDKKVLEDNLAQLKKSLEGKDAELNSLRGQFTKEGEELKKLKENLAKCDSNSEVQKGDIQNLKGEKENLEKSLKEAQASKNCDDACAGQVNNVIKAASAAIGTEKMKQALADAQLDSEKLMKGIQEVKVQGSTAEPQKQAPSTAAEQNGVKPVGTEGVKSDRPIATSKTENDYNTEEDTTDG